MNNTNKTNIRNLSLTGIMLAVILALQAINLPNIVTGIIVNSILIFVFLYIGLKQAIVLGVLTPFGGLITGHVIPVMFPIMPLIALGNYLMIILFNRLSNQNIGIKLFIPALIKAIVIGLGGMIAIRIFMPKNIPNFILISVLGIQFFTALPGIWLGIKLSKKITQINNS